MEKWQNTLVSLKNKICTARNAKIAAAFCVVAVIATAGGHYYLHQQHLARHAEKVEAMTEMTKAQAQQRNVNLISEDQACAAAAQAIGKDESDINFQEVALFDRSSLKKGPKDGPKDRDKGDRYGRKDGDDRQGDNRHERRGPQGKGQDPQGPRPDAAAGATAKAGAPQDNGQGKPMLPPPNGQAPQDGQKPADGQDAQAQPQQGQGPRDLFHPMYNVRMTSGSVRYDVLIDAATGSVIHTEIED
ncbi:MAG: hypothetical protein ACI4NR_08590 [Megasphaera sp.]|uniref:hypothetical protein n=1 Tax=Megasphaera sp. TaxID=2023260 RepID=UPI003F00F732